MRPQDTSWSVADESLLSFNGYMTQDAAILESLAWFFFLTLVLILILKET